MAPGRVAPNRGHQSGVSVTGDELYPEQAAASRRIYYVRTNSALWDVIAVVAQALESC